MKGRLCLVLLILFVTSLVGVSAETTKTGILVDAACAGRMGGDESKAAAHKVSCSLMPQCEASGFGIVTDGKFLKFDKDGDAKAVELLKSSDSTGSFKVTVTGDVDGDNIAVKTIQPVG